jgi:hypothetical protein
MGRLMKNMKFVRFEIDGQETVVVFSQFISHNEIGQLFSVSKDNIVSAGFVGVKKESDNTYSYITYGSSFSLKIDSIDSDSDFINQKYDGQWHCFAFEKENNSVILVPRDFDFNHYFNSQCSMINCESVVLKAKPNGNAYHQCSDDNFSKICNYMIYGDFED